MKAERLLVEPRTCRNRKIVLLCILEALVPPCRRAPHTGPTLAPGRLQVYHNTKVALQKVLGVTSKATARELCIQVAAFQR